jgi:hypothetical protein
MKRKVRWSYVTIALAVIAALAIASPAIGGPSLKKLVKKEVSKQIKKATGPPGPAGANGTNGADGTARAYGTVSVLDGLGAPTCAGPPSTPCPLTDSKGIESVVRSELAGGYCVTAPGIDSRDTSAAVTVEASLTNGPEGNASAMTDEFDSSVVTACGDPGDPRTFLVRTERQPVITVDANGGTSSADVSGPATLANDVSFTIVIP